MLSLELEGSGCPFTNVHFLAKRDIYALLLGRINGEQRILSAAVHSPLPAAENNPCAKAAYLGVSQFLSREKRGGYSRV